MTVAPGTPRTATATTTVESGSPRLVPTTVTRVSDIDWATDAPSLAVVATAREAWGTGDYVVARVESTGTLGQVERPGGRMAGIGVGDRIVGALGRRAATLEAVGDWRDVGPEGGMDLLTSAGLLGQATSVAPYFPTLTRLQYLGHLHRDGHPMRMTDGVTRGGTRIPEQIVLIIGTSMSAGKTESAKVVIRALTGQGRRVVAAKLTGAARHRDSLSMWDAGAEAVYDFVDGGLPSTACSTDEFLPAAHAVLDQMCDTEADVAVVEAGASPLEEYNGATLLSLLGDHVVMTLLCASDPYAVAGLVSAFGRQPDLVAGGAANTSAARRLVADLCGLPALNLVDPATHPRLRDLLLDRIS